MSLLPGRLPSRPSQPHPLSPRPRWALTRVADSSDSQSPRSAAFPSSLPSSCRPGCHAPPASLPHWAAFQGALAGSPTLQAVLSKGWVSGPSPLLCPSAWHPVPWREFHSHTSEAVSVSTPAALSAPLSCQPR